MVPLEKLIKEAKRAAELSYSPYSHYRVGACVEVDGDMWYSGTNIENASYGLTICAERVAICKAVSHGHKLLKRVIVYASSQQVKTAPCGACRQFIKEFADDDTRIYEVCDTDSMMVFTMEELLPKAFGPANLSDDGARKMSRQAIQEAIAKKEAEAFDSANVLNQKSLMVEPLAGRRWEDEEKANYTVESLREEFQGRLYGGTLKYKCLDCRDRGFFNDCLSGGTSYCTCTYGKELAALAPPSDPLD